MHEGKALDPAAAAAAAVVDFVLVYDTAAQKTVIRAVDIVRLCGKDSKAQCLPYRRVTTAHPLNF